MSETHKINLEEKLPKEELEYLLRGPSEKDLLFSTIYEIIGNL